MSKPSTNLRLFVGIYPPPEIQRWLVNRLRKLTLPSHRPSELEQVHMTVQFIGDVAASQLEATIESVRRSASGLSPFQLQPHKLISLPQRGAARLVAAECEAPPVLLELQRRLAVRLADPKRRKREDGFLAHFTLCRFSPRMIEPIDWPIECEPFPVARVMLMRSTLLPTGARHEEIAAVELT
ncbi:MAG: RNA 2',3'-cyclic phosphodiesterase [Myxococcota bacterium]